MEFEMIGEDVVAAANETADEVGEERAKWE